MISKRENDFNGLAWVYDKLGFVVFGDTILKAQQAFLSHIPAHSKVLFLGGGTGNVLPLVCQQNPTEIYYMEKSEQMLQRAQKQILPPTCIHWIHGDETHPAIQSLQFDLILTFFLLDLFEESSLKTLMENLSQKLSPNGQWMVADFNPDAQGTVAKILYKSMYAFFRFTSKVQATHLPDYPAQFRQLGFLQIEKQHFYSQIIQALVYQKANE